ncbi:HAMP domain-containing sensor histidine kinase [soil metagenome]
MKRRVMRTALGSAAFALAILVIPLAIVAVVLFVGQARQTLEHDALAAALAVGPSYATGDPVELGGSGESTVGLFDLQGKRVSGSGPSRWDSVTAQAASGKLVEGGDATAMVVAEPVSNNESVIAVVRSSRPWSSIIFGAILICFVILAVAAGVIGITYLFARRAGAALIGPVERLAAAAASLGDGALTVPNETSGVEEIDEVRRALRLSAGRLEELLARERRIGTNASHQLRTPLTGMRALLETSLDGDADSRNAAVLESIATIDRLDATIDYILALTRGPIAGSLVPLSEVIERSIQRWKSQFDAVGRPLRSVAEEEASDACGPRSMTESVLDVLLDNALGHGQGETTVVLRETVGAIAIDVTDRGHASGSVDLFVDGVSESGGTGLGLGIARRAAEDHGARLVLATTAPETRFTLLIPQQSGAVASTE